MIRIDPDGGSVQIEFPHGGTVQVEGLAADVAVEREEQRALFLDGAEAETLAKMIDYILGQIGKGALKIRPESEEALRAIRPRFDALFGQ